MSRLTEIQAREGLKVSDIKIGAVTPTCSPERAKLLKFVIKRMQNQTRKLDMHEIVDYTKTTVGNDISARFTKGLQKCFDAGCDYVLLVEDDDRYPTTYVQEMTEHWLRNNMPPLIGCDINYYYHLISLGYKMATPRTHASAHCTGVGASAIYKMNPMPSTFYDIALWRANPNGKLVQMANPVISMKHGIGLCGGRGHIGKGYYSFDTKDHQVLKDWVKEDYPYYEGVIDALKNGGKL